MSIPAIQKAVIGAYIAKKLSRGERFPLVLMLEPLFRCNLRCTGCGKTAHPREVLQQQLGVAECVEAAEECGAPVVSIPGGEPLLHPDIHEIARELIARKKFVYLCTNGLLVDQRLDDFTPSPYLTFNIHIDGLAEKHDRLVSRPGTFAQAVAAVEKLLARGFRVTTNTTIFQGETPENAARLFDTLTGLGVEGMTVSPGFSYEKAAGQDQFLGRQTTQRLFREILALGKNRPWRFNHSGLYLSFLAGEQDYACTPWGNPTRNIFGWQKPCYLLDDGYAGSFEALMATTDWDRYGRGRDPRCADCMVHCGFEPTAVIETVKHPLRSMAAMWRPRKVSAVNGQLSAGDDRG
ncbi:MAG: adenosyl-hopene transferase HpnH [Desulfobacteraceae bacterium]|nr:adenosyl-hopene transferase HpnH [Desulfobacteraceae bacterium]